MIDPAQYFGKYMKDAKPEHIANANKLLVAVNNLMFAMEEDGVKFPVNPITKSQVSGETLGGFRPADCPIGASRSAHKTGEAVDIYDPNNDIDHYIWTNQHTMNLDKFGLYFEHQDHTPHWSHWSIRKPMSGRRFFRP